MSTLLTNVYFFIQNCFSNTIIYNYQNIIIHSFYDSNTALTYISSSNQLPIPHCSLEYLHTIFKEYKDAGKWVINRTELRLKLDYYLTY